MTVSLRSTACACASVVLCWASIARAQAAPRFGTLTYPAPGNIQLDEGSVELWVVTGFDVQDQSNAAATYFSIAFPDENWHYVLNHIGWGRAMAMVGYAFPQQSYVWSKRLEWKLGEPHHVAWTWRGAERSLYLDGVIGESGPNEPPLQGEGRVGTTERVVVEGWLHGDLTRALLVIGRAHSRFTLDEVRISSIARPVEMIREQMDAAPSPDAYTLLLDHCDGGPAHVVSGFSGETAGRLEGDYEIVDSWFGKAIRLWKE